MEDIGFYPEIENLSGNKINRCPKIHVAALLVGEEIIIPHSYRLSCYI